MELKSMLVIFLMSNVSGSEIFRSFNLNVILDGLRNVNSSSVCGDHMTKYLEELNKEELWAQTMYDSSSNILHGIFKGNYKIVNHFDECLSVEHPEKHVTSQHCMSSMDFLIGNSNIGQINRTSKFVPIMYGVCLPSSCSKEDIEKNLNNWFNKTYTQSIVLKDVTCSAKKEFEKSDWKMIIILSLIAVTGLISTFYDFIQRNFLKNNQPHVLLRAFSMYTNSGDLFQSKNDSEIRAINGIKALSLCWIVFGHVAVLLFKGAAENSEEYFTVFRNANYVPIWNFLIAVDVFFFLSGYLISYLHLGNILKKRYYDIPLYFIHRYLRLTPSFLIVLLVHATFYLKSGSGPLWNDITLYDQVCPRTWHFLLLYVGNYFFPLFLCLPHTWSLAVDMQLFWLSPIMLLPILLRPRFAPFYFALLISFSTYASFSVHYENQFSTNVYKDMPKRFYTEHILTHTRATPWLIGLAFGYLTLRIQENKIEWKISKVDLSHKFWQFLGWLVSVALFLWSLYGAVLHTNTSLEMALYTAFQKISISVALFWVVFSCLNGSGGAINSFLSSNFLQILGKLSYSIYLIHLSVIKFLIGTRKSGYYFDAQELFGTFFNTMVLCIILSIPLKLLVEIPVRIIESFIFRDVKIYPIFIPSKENENKKTD